MEKVVGVKFKKAGKIYYFSPGDYDIKAGDNVIVETARGLEFGIVTMGCKEVPESEIVSPLKSIIRVANENDRKKHADNLSKKEDALRKCQEKIDKHGLEMKLIDVEYTFDNSKVIFYFTADGRVDFRELVKDLASVFHTRIELRQIGVRDEAKMIGGIGHCGKPLCCHQWMSEFEPVSIKMAKTQNMSLNPTKISGICGRLMCCLKYENDIYNELKRGMPDNGETIKTPDGLAVVYDTNILASTVRVRLVQEEDADEGDGLSSDIYTFKKDEIRRIRKKNKRQKVDKKAEEELDVELTDEIKDLLKD
ncbi:MAG: stage 0 sporulation family protein [Firmicutes bacterium]|nr:stage 0 sporulation family protein [Bacillota bacterium]